MEGFLSLSPAAVQRACWQVAKCQAKKSSRDRLFPWQLKIRLAKDSRAKRCIMIRMCLDMKRTMMCVSNFEKDSLSLESLDIPIEPSAHHFLPTRSTIRRYHGSLLPFS